MAKVFGEDLDGFAQGVPGFAGGGVEARGGSALGLLRSIVRVAVAHCPNAGDAFTGGEAVAVGVLLDLLDENP